MTAPNAGSSVLDLRVDIDPRYANSPVTDRVSGDIYRLYRVKIPGRPPVSWRVYQRSWIVDAPSVSWSRCSVTLTGTVRYWKGSHPPTTVTIEISWGSFQPAGPAEVVFTESGGATTRYSCPRVSDCFRDLNLEVDVAASVNSAPVLPTYDTHDHANRPSGTPQRTLTVEEAYREAGICLRIRPDRTEIDDSAPKFSTWSSAELHDAMETHFSQFSGRWPNWEMWGLLAGTFDRSSVGGIMFDYSGTAEPPERQGFAVFRNHSWFDDLVDTPSTQDEAAAMRKFLYTWVHEAGHAFNFLHSWDKARPDALSWMNYDWRYDNRNGSGSFWGDFALRFDDEELVHLRHGDRSEVIPGGDPWSTGGHLEAPPGAQVQVEGDPPVEILVRSKEQFSLLEPLTVEVRLRNLLDGLPVELDTRLDPEFGVLAVYVQRPGGDVKAYEPVACKLGEPETTLLQPAGARPGEERYSQSVLLSFDRRGFVFDQPGEYLVRAVYLGLGDTHIASTPHRVYVRRPVSREEEALAGRFLTDDVGMALYLGGSRSPFLADGLAVLEHVVERFRDDVVGAKVASVIAGSFGRPFFRVEDNALRQAEPADPEHALELMEPAREVFRASEEPALNLDYHRLVSERSAVLADTGETDRAREGLTALRDDLAARGVNEPVLEDIAARAGGS